VNETVDGNTVSIVAKEKLAKAILNSNAAWQGLSINADDRASNPKFAPQWRRIFTDPQFCENDPGCLNPPESKSDISDIKPKPDNSAAKKLLLRLRFEFANWIQTQTENGSSYTTADPNIGTDYLLGSNIQSPIFCVGPELPQTPKPTVLKLP